MNIIELSLKLIFFLILLSKILIQFKVIFTLSTYFKTLIGDLKIIADAIFPEKFSPITKLVILLELILGNSILAFLITLSLKITLSYDLPIKVLFFSCSIPK